MSYFANLFDPIIEPTDLQQASYIEITPINNNPNSTPIIEFRSGTVAGDELDGPFLTRDSLVLTYVY